MELNIGENQNGQTNLEATAAVVKNTSVKKPSEHELDNGSNASFDSPQGDKSRKKRKKFAGFNAVRIGIMLTLRVYSPVVVPALVGRVLMINRNNEAESNFALKIQLFDKLSSINDLLSSNIGINLEMVSQESTTFPGADGMDLVSTKVEELRSAMDSIIGVVDKITGSPTLNSQIFKIFKANVCVHYFQEQVDRGYSCEDELLNSGLDTLLTNVLERMRKIRTRISIDTQSEIINDQTMEELDDYANKISSALVFLTQVVKIEYIESTEAMVS